MLKVMVLIKQGGKPFYELPSHFYLLCRRGASANTVRQYSPRPPEAGSQGSSFAALRAFSRKFVGVAVKIAIWLTKSEPDRRLMAKFTPGKSLLYPACKLIKILDAVESDGPPF